jgi:glycosyltransferase involved in cell wall biosynthesis
VRVLLVSLYGRGGMTHYTSQLANALVNDNEVTIVAPTHIEQKYFSSNINFILIKAPPSLILSILYLFNYVALLELLRSIRLYNPDIIHFLNEHPLNNIILFRIRYKTVLTCHDPIKHSGERNKFVMQLFKWSESNQLKKVDKIIVHGKNLLNDLKKQNIKSDKIEITPHGDYSFFLNYAKSDIKEDNSILFFGRIKPYKGIEYLIEAESIISKIVSNYKIIIAGEGEISPYKKHIKNDSKFIIINEYISDREVALLFKKASIVVLPYTDASQSGIIPIAYAFKKPVVVTNVGSISEIVDDKVTGFIVPPRDASALADAIIKLLGDDELRKKMGENAHKKMIDEMSWDKIAEDTIKIYKRIINYQTI